MGRTTPDTGQPDNDPAPPMVIRPLWGLRRRITAYARSRNLSTSTAMILLLDDALTRKGFR